MKIKNNLTSLLSVDELEMQFSSIDQCIRNAILGSTGRNGGIVWGLQLGVRLIGPGLYAVSVAPGLAYDGEGHRVEIRETITLQYADQALTQEPKTYEVILKFEEQRQDKAGNNVINGPYIEDGYELVLVLPQDDYPASPCLSLGKICTAQLPPTISPEGRYYIHSSMVGSGTITSVNPHGTTLLDLGIGGDLATYLSDLNSSWIFSQALSSASLEVILVDAQTLSVTAMQGGDVLYLKGVPVSSLSAMDISFGSQTSGMYYVYVDSEKETVGTSLAKTGFVLASVVWDGKILSSLQDCRVFAPVGAEHLQVNSVTAVKIESQTLTSDKIALGAVTTAKIASQAITAEKIASQAIEGTHIANHNILSSHLQDGVITADLLADESILTEHILARSINGEQIAVGGLAAGNLGQESVTLNKLSPALRAYVTTVTPDHDHVTSGGVLGANSIHTEHFVDKSVTTSKLAFDLESLLKSTVVGAHTHAASGTGGSLAPSSVLNNNIKAASITEGKLEDNLLDLINHTGIYASSKTYLMTDIEWNWGSGYDVTEGVDARHWHSGVGDGGTLIPPDVVIMYHGTQCPEATGPYRWEIVPESIGRIPVGWNSSYGIQPGQYNNGSNHTHTATFSAVGTVHRNAACGIGGYGANASGGTSFTTSTAAMFLPPSLSVIFCKRVLA